MRAQHLIPLLVPALSPRPKVSGPQFVSAEVGNFDAATIVVTFDQDMNTDGGDAAAGAQFTVNGSAPNPFDSAEFDGHDVHFIMVDPVSHGDVLTWQYSAASGHLISMATGLHVGDYAAQPVTNNVS